MKEVGKSSLMTGSRVPSPSRKSRGKTQLQCQPRPRGRNPSHDDILRGVWYSRVDNWVVAK